MTKEINKIQNNMVKLQKDIEFIKISLDENKKDCKEMIAEIKKWIIASDKKFANKWTEKVLVWMGAGIGGVLIVALMGLILKQ